MSRNPAIHLVTVGNSQTQLFTGYLGEHFDCPARALRPSTQPSDIEEERMLVLLDADHVDMKHMYQWHERAEGRLSVILAGFNLKCEDQAAHILTSLRLKGVFYRHDSLAQFCKGVGVLLEGHSWLSRSLMSRLIASYRSQTINIHHANSGLTRRELEVLSLLGSGDTNSRIACKLLVSEHTVRAHLYNIFRKLRVYNRFQAMHWARQNLYLSPTLPTQSKQVIKP